MAKKVGETEPQLFSEKCTMRGYRAWRIALLALLMLGTASLALAAVTPIGPLPYLSLADSPFLSDPTLDVVVEDFEDGLFNAPGMSLHPGFNDHIMLPSQLTDSVDADDGLVNGSGQDGFSLEVRSFAVVIKYPLIGVAGTLVEFQVDKGFRAPSAFGFVWTDGEPGSTVSIIARDVLGGSHVVDFAGWLGDQTHDGLTAEDSFFGVYSDVGLMNVSIGSSFEFHVGTGQYEAIELDHLQYGVIRVPEPCCASMLIAILVTSTITRWRSL